MKVDYRQAPAELLARTYDFCIIGGGAAGLILAQELSKQPSSKVCLLEGGDDQFHSEIQELYQADFHLKVGKQTYSDPQLLKRTRVRTLGGTTFHWGRRLMRFQPIDFEDRPWLNSKWPIPYHEILPYYDRANLYFGYAQNESFEWQKLKAERDGFVLKADEFEHEIQRISKHQNLKDTEGLTKALGSVTLLTNANFKSFQWSKDRNQVQEALIQSFDLKKSDRIKAHTYILATGTIENSRLLLNQKDDLIRRTPHAAQNIGRYFMGHLNLMASDNYMIGIPSIEKTQIESIYSRWSEPVWDNDKWVAGFRLKDQLQREMKLVNGLLVLGNIYGMGTYRPITDEEKLVFAAFDNWTEKPFFLQASVVFEQSPSSSNRIQLGSQADRFGLKKAEVYNTVSPGDLDSIRKSVNLLGLKLGELHLGRVRSLLSDGKLFEVLNKELSYHHLGGTPMGADATTSVVNPNLKLHEADNLYVCGSSVFPTGSFANPTLTIAALSIRLADHLKGEI